MIWIVIICVVFFAYNFFKRWMKDEENLKNTTVVKKFNVLGEQLNEYIFNGIGEIKYNPSNKIAFHIYTKDSPKIILFTYSNSSLVIDFRFKYLMEKELRVKEIFRNINNITENEQIVIAEEMKKRIELSLNKLKSI